MSAISVREFKDPKSLANFLQKLVLNETEYDKYLSHKLSNNYEIHNERLKKAFEKNTTWFRNEFGNYVEEFECFICENIQKQRKKKVVDKEHYDCPLPINPLTNEVDHNNWWVKQWIVEKCGAKVLTYYLQNNLTINMENFEKEKLELYDKNNC